MIKKHPSDHQIEKEESKPIFDWCQRVGQTIKEFFYEQKLTETRKGIVLNDLIDAGSPGVDFFILILFSSAIASLGLIADSSVVTIGAQLIDPLMSPILGLAIASLSGLNRMFKRSLIAVFEGAALAIGVSSLISFFAYRLPYGINAHIPHEVMLRTIASPLDLGIAFAGGAAAAFALAHPRLDAALPGVAIATAIMPPLCTIGFGIAFQSSPIIMGAILQFFTNFAAISFAAIVTFAILGFSPNTLKKENDLTRSVLVSAAMLLIVAVPLAILGWRSISSARLNSRASALIMENLPAETRPYLVDLSINSIKDMGEFEVTLQLVRDLTEVEARALRGALSDQLDIPITLKIITLPVMIIE